MRAIVVAPNAPNGMAFAEIPAPRPAAHQMLIEVTHVSLNHGDINDAHSGRIAEGGTLGSDVVGTVAIPAAGGPRAGERVLAMTAGAFAHFCLADAANAVVLPAQVASAQAVALPVAGLAALQGLKQAGVERGSRVLITGASGGVGRFAVQLAALWGTHVSAIANHHHNELRALGAHAVAASIGGLPTPFTAVLDTVGGPLLSAAWQQLAPGGRAVCVGSASGEATIFEPYALIGPSKALMSFMIGGDIAGDLAELVDVLAQGQLAVDIGWQGSWDTIDTAIDALLNGGIGGKFVLQVGP